MTSPWEIEVPSRDEQINPLTLTFKSFQLEQQYQLYRFQVTYGSLIGRFGLLSVTSMVSLFCVLGDSAEGMISFIQHNTPGSIHRVFALFPILAFSIYHQWAVSTNRLLTNDKKSYCPVFAIWWVCLVSLAEILSIYANESFVEDQGCPSKRFRCPYSFSSSNFSARALVVGALLVFRITQSLPFVGTAMLSLTLCGASRVLGLFVYDAGATSLWSTACVCIQMVAFLACSYTREVRDRKQYLAHLHIVRLRSSLEVMRESMLPEGLAARVERGDVILSSFEDAAVLLCTFVAPKEIKGDAPQLVRLVAQVADINSCRFALFLPVHRERG